MKRRNTWLRVVCVFLVSDELGTFIAAHTVGRDYTRNELINARRPWKLLEVPNAVLQVRRRKLLGERRHQRYLFQKPLSMTL